MVHLRKPHRLLPALLAGALAMSWPLESLSQYRGRDVPRTSDTPGTSDAPPSSDAPPESSPPRRRRDRDSGFETGAAIVGAGIIFCALTNCLGGSRGGRQITNRDLLRDGPMIPQEYALGTLSAYGFVRNNWPVVVDYETAPEADVTLTITVGRDSWVQRLRGGRQQTKLFYEGRAAPTSTPAQFVLTSTIRGRDGSETPQPIELIGLGCGPRAVGSVAINNLSFRPSARLVGGDYARFGYAATSPFNKVGMEILRYTGRRDGSTTVITVTPVAIFQEQSRPPGAYGPKMWNGLDSSQRGSSGLHRLRVRGWETDGDESWVAAISRDVVQIP